MYLCIINNKKVRHTAKTVYIMYISFHKTRGGKFFNPGYIEFVGEFDFQQLQSHLSSFILIKNKDDKGRFCKPYLTDCDGNIISEDDLKSRIGTIDFDGDYDTYYSIDSEDMDCEERNAIRRDKGYISPELQELLFSYNLEDGIEDDD